MTENGSLKTALGLAVSMLSAEHIFSATLSSPWTTGKLSQSEEDQKAFWRLFAQAAVASVIFAVVIGYILHDKQAFVFSIAGTLAILGWMYWDYSEALSGRLYEND